MKDFLNLLINFFFFSEAFSLVEIMHILSLRYVVVYRAIIVSNFRFGRLVC